jgi:hypothetical protein
MRRKTFAYQNFQRNFMLSLTDRLFVQQKCERDAHKHEKAKFVFIKFLQRMQKTEYV